MKQMKPGIILLALLLAAMAMMPVVSAADTAKPSRVSEPVNGAVYVPDHILPPEYFKNAKPAEPLPESQMITMVFSAKSLTWTGENTKSEIEIPSRYLNPDTGFTRSKDNPSRYIDPALDAGDPVVLVRMPRSMFDRFVAQSGGKSLVLPTQQFARQYANLADMEAHLKTNGTSLEVSPGENDSIEVTAAQTRIRSGIPGVMPTPSVPGLSKAAIPSAVAATTVYGEWAFFNRKNTGTSYNYLIGQITPDYWYESGRNDHFYIPQEREIYLNDHQDAIEIIVNYQDNALTNGRGGIVTLFPAIYDNHAAYPTPLPSWESSGAGIITLPATTFPHAYGYHVQIYNGKYYITFEDMNTLGWYAQYVYNDQDNPSTTFTDIYGSSEYVQENSPISDQFVAWTYPVIDEWARESATGTWRKPVDVWQNIGQSADVAFVHIAWNMDSAGNLITQSFAEYRWA
jgi:hypothetical protein